MTESIEWGACPVCGGRVAGEVDSWECNGRLHVKQSYDNPPTCENGCPLEGFAPRIDLVAECGDGESDKETAERAAKKEWSRMCGIATRVDPCVCGGTPVLKPEECRLECPDCGRMTRPTPSLVQAIAAWNDCMAGLRKRDAERAGMGLLAKGVGLGVVSAPRLLPSARSARNTANVWSVCVVPSRNARAGTEPKAGGGGTVLGFFLWDA